MIAASRGEPAFGSTSKLQRPSRLMQAFRRSSKRLFTPLHGRDTPVLVALFILTMFLHVRLDMSGRLDTIVTRSTQVWKPEMEGIPHHTPFKMDKVQGKVLRRERETSGPPSYLPLAQHLKNINLTKHSPSLDDMAYGQQKRTLPDLKATDNTDLESCEECVENSKKVLASEFLSKKRVQLARVVAKLITLYKITSMLVLPCAEEAHWIFSLVKAIREVYPNFEHYCAVSDDSRVVEIIKHNGPSALEGTQFVIYKPMKHGHLPSADLMFSWQGLELFTLDEIHQTFKDVSSVGIKHTLIGSSPGQENAKLIETGKGIYSIARADIPVLNVRAFPFGFNQADRVVPVLERQLLMYNTTDMRDTW